MNSTLDIAFETTRVVSLGCLGMIAGIMIFAFYKFIEFIVNGMLR